MFLTTPTGARFQGASPPICKLFMLAELRELPPVVVWEGQEGRGLGVNGGALLSLLVCHQHHSAKNNTSLKVRNR